MKKLAYIILLVLILSCNNEKKENIKKLNTLFNNIKIAEKSSDPELVEMVISEIAIMENIYPKQQSLKEHKYMLEIRLKKYNDAISTIESLLQLSPNDIDNRIIQGILLEVSGYKAKSVIVFEKSLELMDMKIKNMLKGDVNKRLGREVNRVMILKLLYIDQPSDYNRLLTDPDMANYPEIKQLVIRMKNSNREVFLNKYR